MNAANTGIAGARGRAPPSAAAHAFA